MADDFGTTVETSGTLLIGRSVTGVIDVSGDRDWFAVQLVAGHQYTIELEGQSTGAGTLYDPMIQGVYTAAGSQIANSSDDNGGDGRNSELLFTATETATYYISARAASSSYVGSYRLSISDTANAPVTGAVAITGSARPGEVLVADTSALGDEDGLGEFRYQWFRDGVVTEGATTDRITLGDGDIGSTFSVQVSYEDGVGALESLTSAASATVSNHAGGDPGSMERQVSVGTLYGQQTDPAMATLSDGRFVIVTASSSGVFGQFYSAAGAAEGPRFQIDELQNRYQYNPEVAADGDGGFFVVWQGNAVDGTGYNILARHYDSAGQAIGSEVQVNSEVAGRQIEPRVAQLSDGGHIVIWQSGPENLSDLTVGQDGSGWGIFGQRYDSAGVAAGGEFQVNTLSEHHQWSPSVAALSDGGFVVTWSTRNGNTSDTDIHGQRYDASSVAVGEEFVVNSHTDGSQSFSDVTALSGDRLLITWSSFDERAVIGQILDSAGTPSGEAFEISSSESASVTDTRYPSATALSDGGFVVVWSSNAYPNDALWGHRFDASGASAGGIFEINLDTNGERTPIDSGTEGAVTALEDGGFAVAWEIDYRNGLSGRIYADNHFPAGEVVITGDAAEDERLRADTSFLSDAEGLGSLSYQWLRDGVVINGATEDGFTLNQQDVGTQLSVVVTYIDSEGALETMTSAATDAVRNVNDAPTGALGLQRSITERSLATARLNSVDDEDGLGEMAYQWLRDGEEIEGATRLTYLPRQIDVGAQLTIRATYTDGQGTVETLTSSPSNPVINVNDTPRGQVVITGSPVQHEVLTVDTSGLTDADGLGTFTYQWLSNGAVIDGATEATFAPGQAQVGRQISVQVSYTDAYGTEESVTSASTAEVTDVNDQPTGNIAITGLALQGNVLRAIPADLADEDGLGSLTYQWFRDGIAVTNETGSTYTVTTNDFDAFLTVRATYVDGFGTTETVTSEPLGFGARVEMTSRPSVNPITHLGGELNERFSGYEQGDLLAGGNGHDTILGGDGNDTILGYLADAQIEGPGEQYNYGEAVLADYSPLTVSMTSVQETSASSVTVSGFVSPEVFTTESADVVVVMDISGSTSSGFVGTYNVPDANRDGTGGTVLDAEIVAFDSLMESITNEARMGDSAVTLIPFSSGASVYARGTAGADANQDGLADIVRASQNLRSNGGTDFLPPLDLAISHFQASPAEQRILYFLSDGEASTSGVPYRVQQLQALGVDVRTYAVGTDASEDNMDYIDDGILNGSATVVADPSLLSARLTESTIDRSAISAVQVLLNGQVVNTYDASILTPSPFGLRFDLDVDGLTSETDTVEVRVIAADGASTTVNVRNEIYDAGPTDHDVLYGGNGHDSIDGGPGDDVLYGGEGADSLIGNYGDDTLDGGVGVDTALYDLDRADAFIIRYGDEATVTSSYGTDVLRAVELLQFNDELVRFSSLPDTALIRHLTLTGSTGNDVMRGESGNDTLHGEDGSDTLIGNAGNDVLIGGSSTLDVRDVIYGGEGDDSIDGGYGNDELRGDAGTDTITGGFGVDTIFGGDGNDVLTGQAWSDLIFGGAGDDFINGGFGFDRVNGGIGADRFYHLGTEGHGSDWIQDYNGAEGDVLIFGQTGASADQFQVNFTETPNAGADGVAEAFVIYRPTGQILWALVDGEAQREINLVLGGETFDLVYP